MYAITKRENEEIGTFGGEYWHPHAGWVKWDVAKLYETEREVLDAVLHCGKPPADLQIAHWPQLAEMVKLDKVPRTSAIGKAVEENALSANDLLRYRAEVLSLYLERSRPMFKQGTLQIWWGVMLMVLSVLVPFVHVWGVQFGPETIRPYKMGEYYIVDPWGVACFLACLLLLGFGLFNTIRGFLRRTEPGV